MTMVTGHPAPCEEWCSLTAEFVHSAATTGAESHSRAFHVCRRVVHAVAFELLEADGVQPAVVAARCRDDRSAGETRSVILTPDRRYLFTTNGGDNSVSSFSVGEEREAGPCRRQADREHCDPTEWDGEVPLQCTVVENAVRAAHVRPRPRAADLVDADG